ncbi:reverse transcriptase domain-containing protein [Tenacibaculum finnmarkense]|uniref:reverse transcriptase domain-containing protein n=1 Tax=Tenacibaculum finnmarkense TaxID=2781243 RepID=UPI001E5EAECF|nr:reverse transcriptase domain-containing protein [Tenacibaculum finnmarkense]MCD8443804.1 RNA-directed DNA polymerase (Reverse transcriptase) [Tenacibaculum finnmarkense genomovar ulcerans]
MDKKKQKDWFKDRGYPHFSNKTQLSVRKKVESYVSNPQKVAKHSFLPLIFKEIKQRRYKESNFGDENSSNKIRRSHKKLKNGKIISNTKIREILYATHIDAHVYSYYTQKIITPKYEAYLRKNELLSNAVTAYRRIETDDKLKFKNNVHFAKDVFDEIKKRQNCVALVLDIENFFPSLNHKKLKLIWAKTLGCKTLPKNHYNLFKATTRFSYVKLNDLKTKNNHFDEKELAKHRKSGKNTFFENIHGLLDSDIIIHKNQKKNKNNNEPIGIPQGLPISALLANMYMLPFDEAIINELTLKYDVFYRRYSDDIVVLCDENLIDFVQKFIIDEVQKIDLTISAEKTEITLFKIHNNRLQSFKIHQDNLKENIPLNYLGFEFYGYQTLLKSKNLAQFYREMKQTVKRKHKRVEHLKEKLLLDEAPLFKRKLYRLYSFKGVKSREIGIKKRKFRGNYLRYAYRASDDLNAPEIKRQLRNHWKILQKTIHKYDFSNDFSNIDYKNKKTST